jgi:hypothetical protein
MNKTLEFGLKRQMLANSIGKDDDKKTLRSKLFDLIENGKDTDLKAIYKLLKSKEFKTYGLSLEDYSTTSNGYYTFLVKDLKSNNSKWMMLSDIHNILLDKDMDRCRNSIYGL